MSTKDKIYPKECPICGVSTNYTYNLANEYIGDSQWYRCSCGVIFQSELPSYKLYNEKCVGEYSDKDAKKRHIHLADTYATVLEHLTFGRKMIDVGACTTSIMEYFDNRGWIVSGIDLNKDVDSDIIVGDFEEYDFSYDISIDEKEEKYSEKFDMVWLGNTFSCFKNPIKAIQKLYDIISENGILFLNVPDIDFINKCGVGAYPNFKKDEYYVLWNSSSIKRELEKVGFEVVLCRRNFSASYLTHYDDHIICQKRYY